MCPSWVRQGAAGALLHSFPFVDVFLIDTGTHSGSDPMHYFLPWCRWVLGDFSSLFLSWNTRFSLVVYFGYFAVVSGGSFRFRFPLEADPEESRCRSFLPSTKSSLAFDPVLTASNHSLSSAIGSIMDILLTASSGV